MTVAAFDHPFLSGLLGDPDLAAWFSADEDIAAMVRFEIALAEAEAAEDLVPAASAAAIRDALSGLRLDPDAFRDDVARDGVVVPGLVKALRKAVGGEAADHLHKGATSQDLIDTSLMMRIVPVLDLLAERLDGISLQIEALSARSGLKMATARTRMQDARPMPLSRRFDAWAAGVEDARAEIRRLRETVPVVQFGGAIGDRGGLGGKGDRVAARLAAALGLADRPCWHTRRLPIVALGNGFSAVSGVLGKIGQDIALMAQNAIAEVKVTSGGGSSAMPHKNNPVGAEVLVTLARFNAGIAGTLQQALVHEWERSGAAWTLEWMLLPQAAVAAGASTRHAAALLDGIEIPPA